MPNKILITNYSALSDKYGANGLKAVLTATKALVAADRNRGLTTQLVDISNAATMKNSSARWSHRPRTSANAKTPWMPFMRV